MKRVNDHNYIRPLSDEVRQIAKRVGLEGYSPDFIQDVTSLQAGGKFKPLSEIESDLRKVINPTPDSNGEYHLPNGGKTKSKAEAVERILQRQMKNEAGIQENFEGFNVGDVPGSSPLEKTMMYFKYLEAKNGSQEDAEGNQMPVWNNNKEQDEEMKEHFSQVEQIMKDDTLVEIMSEMPQAQQDIAMFQMVELNRISNMLNLRSNFKFKQASEIQPNPMGLETQMRPIKDLSEIALAGPDFFAMPKIIQAIKMARREVLVQENYDRVLKKQLIAVMVDVSGSMGDRNSINIAMGVLLNRLHAVGKGDAELYYAFFDDKLYFKKSNHAHDLKSAKAAMKAIAKRNFSGGGTRIQNSAEAFRKELDGIGGHRPQLVIVTDGGDGVDVQRMLKQVYPYTVHAVIIGGDNPDLVRACRSTGGMAIANFNPMEKKTYDLGAFSILEAEQIAAI